MSYSG